MYRINFASVLNKGKKLSIQDIEKSNNKNSAAPILNTVVYKKGVYKSFAEFKANAPSMQAEYELKRGEMGVCFSLKKMAKNIHLEKPGGFVMGVIYIYCCPR